MNISKEIKLGILAIITIFGMIWGYKFVIGQNILKPSRTFYSYYHDVSGLNVSAPVMVNGFQIGAVTRIEMDDADALKMKITMEVSNKEIKIPKNSIAMLTSGGIVGGKHIVIKFDEICNGENCAISGDVFEGRESSFINTMLGEGELENTISTVTSGLSDVINKLGEEGSEGSVNETIRNLEKVTANLAIFAKSSGEAMSNSQRNLENILANMSKITQTIADDRKKISTMLTNFDRISSDLADAKLHQTVDKTNAVMDNASAAIKDFNSTLRSADEAVSSLNRVLHNMEKGDGTLSRLINDDKLYTNLEFTSKNLALLLQDMRLNPRRYLNLSIFGKGSKDFIPVEDDPAFEGEYEIIRIRPVNKAEGGKNP